MIYFSLPICMRWRRITAKNNYELNLDEKLSPRVEAIRSGIRSGLLLLRVFKPVPTRDVRSRVDRRDPWHLTGSHGADDEPVAALTSGKRRTIPPTPAEHDLPLLLQSSRSQTRAMSRQQSFNLQTSIHSPWRFHGRRRRPGSPLPWSNWLQRCTPGILFSTRLVQGQRSSCKGDRYRKRPR